MRWNYSPIRLLVLFGLLLAATQQALAQSQSVRPVNIWNQDIEQVELFKGQLCFSDWTQWLSRQLMG